MASDFRAIFKCISGTIMKILILTMNIKGGMVHYISQLSNALAEKNDVAVIAPIGMDRSAFSEKVRLTELPLGDVIKNFIANTLIVTRPLKFIKAIRREKPDVIHIQQSHIWWSFFLPYLSRYPLVCTIHDVHPHVGSRKFDQIIGQKCIIHYSNQVIVHGESAKKELLSKYSNLGGRCQVIPIGDFSFFTKYHQNHIKETNTVLYFGRIEDYKGLEYLIRAEPLITEEIPDANIIIAGKGNFEKYRNLIGDANKFEIHNRFIPDEEVPYFFQRAKVIVLPYIEGTQTAIIPIAYAFKRPVVVTKVGSISEVVDDGKTGFIVPPKDEKALADVIVVILKDDKLRKQMGENAYKKMKEELSWDEIAEKTIEVYKNVIRDRS